MKRNTLSLSIALAVIVSVIHVTSCGSGQAGIGGEPPNKLTAVATLTAAVTGVENIPTADPNVMSDKLRLASTPTSSCPNPQFKNMIYDYRPMGPAYERGIVNVAVVIRNDIAYSILAGSPIEIGSQGIIILKQFGLVIVSQHYIDPCAATLAGKITVPDKEYITQSGTLTIARVDGDTVVLSIGDVDVDHFNFITGQFANLKMVPMPTAVPSSTRIAPANP